MADAMSSCGGVAEWLNAAVSKTVYGYSPYEGSNPSSSARYNKAGPRISDPLLLECV